jgi:hypothetical protein
MYNWILLLTYMVDGSGTLNVIQSYQSYMECALQAPLVVETVEAFPNHTDITAQCIELTIKVRD